MDIVAEPGRREVCAGHVAGLTIPDHEVAEDSDRVAAVETPTAPGQRDADLVVRIRGETGIGKGVVGIPDLRLLQKLVVLRHLELSDLDMRLRELETSPTAIARCCRPGEPEL